MDEDTSDMILQLCTKIGMIMEDASVTALTLRVVDKADWQTALYEIGAAAVIITTLADTAKALHSE